MSSPGLPLGIYTNHWHRTVNQAQSGKLGESCEEFEEGGRCPRATKYVPDSEGYESHGYESHGYPIPDIDTDLQGIFDHTEDLIQSVFK